MDNKKINERRKSNLIQLSKEDTFRAHYLNYRSFYSHIHFEFIPKVPYNCLTCGKLIYVNFNRSGRKSVFCDKHYEGAQIPTMVQMQYIKRLKELQVRIMSSADSTYVNVLQYIYNEDNEDNED